MAWSDNIDVEMAEVNREMRGNFIEDVNQARGTKKWNLLQDITGGFELEYNSGWHTIVFRSECKWLNLISCPIDDPRMGSSTGKTIGLLLSDLYRILKDEVSIIEEQKRKVK